MKLHKEGNTTLILELMIFSILNYLAHTFGDENIVYFTAILTGFIFISFLFKCF